MGSHLPLTRPSRAEAAISAFQVLAPAETVSWTTSTVTSTSGLARTKASHSARSSLERVRQGTPRVVELPKKISAKLPPTKAVKPKRQSDCGACSRELPQPKLKPTTMTPCLAAAMRAAWAEFMGCARSLPSGPVRSSRKACSPRPSKVTQRRKRAGMMRSVSMSSPGTARARALTWVIWARDMAD